MLSVLLSALCPPAPLKSLTFWRYTNQIIIIIINIICSLITGSREENWHGLGCVVEDSEIDGALSCQRMLAFLFLSVSPVCLCLQCWFVTVLLLLLSNTERPSCICRSVGKSSVLVIPYCETQLVLSLCMFFINYCVLQVGVCLQIVCIEFIFYCHCCRQTSWRLLLYSINGINLRIIRNRNWGNLVLPSEHLTSARMCCQRKKVFLQARQ